MDWPGICRFILQDNCQVNTCSIILRCPLFISGKITKKCTLCKVKSHHISQFLLVQELKTIFLVSGLGVKDQHNCLVLYHAASFCGVGLKMKYTYQNQENLLNCNNISKIICCCSSRLLKEKCLSVCLPGCRSVRKILGPMLKSHINGSARAFKHCKNCINMAFHFEDTVI